MFRAAHGGKTLGFVNLPALLALFVAVLSISGCGGGSKPIGVSATASSPTVDGGDAITMSAVVTNDKNAAGVSWKLSGPGGLSNTSTASATYTAPAATGSSQSATITATSVADVSKSGSVTITIPAQPSITTSTLTAATVGSAYSATLAGSGGISPYKWSLSSGTLPASITLSSNGTLSGTPLATDAGTLNLTFKVTDSGTPTALTNTKSLTLAINPAPAISFAGTVPNTATFNVAYSGSIGASGGAGALTYSLLSGTLPTGLNLNTSSGAITGTPSTVGTFNFTIKAADAYGDSNTQTYSVKVSYSAVTVTSVTLPVGYVGSNYKSTTLSATGGSGAGYTWALQSGSALPAGLNLSAAGVISGKPSGTPGISSFTVVAADSASNQGTGTFNITVNAAVSITTGTTLPTAYVGSNYSQTLAATGGSGSGYTWAVSNGSTLPGGLTLSSAGVLSGKPTTAGTPGFGITVTDSASNTATAAFSMTIGAGVSITTATTLPVGYQGTVYPGATLAATGGTGTGYTWTWAAANGSTLPAGLSLSASGVISGTPTGSGTSSIVITVTDSAQNTASVTFSLTIEATLAISSTSPMKTATVGAAYSQQLVATGGTGTGYTWSTDSTGTTSLAAIGLSLSSGGVVSGASPTLGTATFTATVTDSASHTASVPFTVSVTNALAVTTSSLPATDAGVGYSQTLAAAGGTGSGYTWSVTAGASSLTAVNLNVSTSGVVSGTPSAAGTATFTVQVKDSGNNTATANLTIQVYSVLSLPAPSSTVPGPGTTGGAYSGTINATGGSGAYAWTITGLPSDGLSATTAGGILTLSGTPTTATNVSFTAAVRDTTTSQSVGPITYNVVVSNPAPLTLPSANPNSLGVATVNQSYSGSITATGGAAPYTWTVNTVTVPTNGSLVSLTNGLSVSNTGTNTLSVSGTPTSTGSVAISASIKDNLGTTAGPIGYSVTVNSAGSQVSGQISLTNLCGGGGGTLPAFTVSIDTSPVKTTTTDSNGNYSFASVPNGTYTITPSITGPSAVFYPATENVTVNNGALTGQNFGVALGYTVSGAVSYSGTNTGRIYLNLINSNCGGSGGIGTSIASTGSFTLHGVSPGTYTLQAWMDLASLANEAQNSSDPTGNASLTLSTANVTGTSINLSDPTVTAPTITPKLKAIAPTDSGVVISYGGGSVLNTNGIEESTSYTVQWSTSSTFASTSSATYKAIGSGSNVWILNGSISGIGGSLTNGTAYYFRVRGSNSAGSGPWSVWGGGTPVAVTIGAPSGSGYNTVTGAVVIPGSVAPNTGASLYTGFFDQNTNTAYATRIGSPNNSAGGNAFSVNVPNGSNYIQFAILDQNNDGLIDASDVTNVFGNNSNTVTISGNMTNQNLTLPSANSDGTVQTQFYQSTFANGGGTTTSSSYSLNLQVREQNKLPVAVQLTSSSNPNVVTPTDVSNYCQGCGNLQFDYYTNIGSDIPAANDSYTFNVTYGDGTTGTVTATVSAVLGTSSLATNLAPTTGSGTSQTPTFSWTDPSNASSYIYQFYMSDNNGNTIWQIPSNNSNLNGFSSSISSITWGTDPTGDTSNTPSVTNLSTGTTYNWSIQAQDGSGNTATQQVQYQP